MPPKKARIQINKFWFFALEIVGFGLSVYLFLVATAVLPTPPCARNSIFACSTILRGPFSHFGPFSVAAMGIVYFVSQLMLTAGLRDRGAQVLKAFLVFSGLIFIAWLRSIELIYERKICPWCWGVAVITLIHAGFSYYLVAPPFPRIRKAGVIGLVLGGFVVLIGLVSIIELSLGLGKKLQGQEMISSSGGGSDEGDQSSVPVAGPDETPAPKPKATPSPTPKRTPTPTPSPSPSVNISPVPPTPSAAAPTPTPRPTSAPTPKLKFDPEPQLQDSEEVRILRKRGWRHAGSGESVITAIKVQPPVLLLAYDPHCSDCYRLITQILDRDVMNGLHVTRIAIQESMLSGEINGWIKELPTIVLIDEEGTELYKHTGSKISPEQLAAEINQALGR